jgi:NADPH2:quinone reductase
MATMRAAVLDGPGAPERLEVRRIPIPEPKVGWARIRVEAFGLNRSELHTRLGLAEGVTFPRVLGIEATGIIDACPGGEFEVGQQVAALMGGMGRTFDGGYAEYTCVPVPQVVPFESRLDWATLGAVPEMLQTAHGSLTVGLNSEEGHDHAEQRVRPNRGSEERDPQHVERAEEPHGNVIWATTSRVEPRTRWTSGFVWGAPWGGT